MKSSRLQAITMACLCTFVIAAAPEDPLPGSNENVTTSDAATRMTATRKAPDFTKPFLPLNKTLRPALDSAQKAGRAQDSSVANVQVPANAGKGGGVVAMAAESLLDQQVTTMIVVVDIERVGPAGAGGQSYVVHGEIPPFTQPTPSKSERESLLEVGKAEDAELAQFPELTFNHKKGDPKRTKPEDDYVPGGPGVGDSSQCTARLNHRGQIKDRYAIVKGSIRKFSSERRPPVGVYIVTEDPQVEKWKPSEKRTVVGIIQKASFAPCYPGTVTWQVSQESYAKLTPSASQPQACGAEGMYHAVELFLDGGSNITNATTPPANNPAGAQK
jgi:hypothetical protein